MNSLMYADDLILLSNTIHDLQVMFDLYSIEFAKLDLPINVYKCHCIRIGPRFNIQCCPISCNGVNVNWTDKIKYLGITINNGPKFKCSWHEKKIGYYSCVNKIFGRLSFSVSEYM